MITFYDFASKLSERTFHPHAWKTRYTLNYKGIPYRTEWVEYPDIKGICKKMGIPPTLKWPDGSDRYTLPAIYDSSTGTGVAESLLIAAYLDETYPDTPKVLPSATAALQDAFVDAFMSKLGSAPKIFFPIMLKLVNTPSSNYLLAAVQKTSQDALLVEEDPEADWKSLKDGFSALDGWYQKNGGGPFIMGDTPSFGDFAVGGFLAFGKYAKDDISGWENVSQWNDGRWKKLSEALDKYE